MQQYFYRSEVNAERYTITKVMVHHNWDPVDKVTFYSTLYAYNGVRIFYIVALCHKIRFITLLESGPLIFANYDTCLTI